MPVGFIHESCHYLTGLLCGYYFNLQESRYVWNPDGTFSKYSDKTIVVAGSEEENKKWGKGKDYSYAPRCRDHFVRPDSNEQKEKSGSDSCFTTL